MINRIGLDKINKPLDFSNIGKKNVKQFSANPQNNIPVDTVNFSSAKKIAAKEALNSIPEDLRTLFNILKNENGEEFVNKAYKGIVKHLGIEDVAPSKVDLNTYLLGSVIGGFSPPKNSISYSRSFLKLPKEEQFNCLAHEAKHCKQFNTMIRTEGIGIPQVAEILLNKSINNITNSSSMNFFQRRVRFSLDNAQEKGTLRKEIVDEVTRKIEKAYSAALKLPKISADSEEGRKAKEYLEAFREYQDSGMCGMGSKYEAYRSNLLEQEAFAFGDKMEKYFADFLKFSK